MTLRRSLRRSFDKAAGASGLVSWLERRMGSGWTVLTYHRVLPQSRCADYPFPSLAMPKDAFHEQMRELAARFDVLPVGEALVRARHSGKHDRPLVSVTFDDGYDDQHDIAAPVLDELGLRATFYVTSGFVAARGMLWFDRAAAAFAAADAAARAQAVETLRASRALRASGALRANRASRANRAPHTDLGTELPPGTQIDGSAWVECLKSASAAERERLVGPLEGSAGPLARREGFAPMSPADVADLARRGHEVGSHTVDHEILPGLGDAELAATLERSRSDLARWTGAPVGGFCFPNGDHDARTVEAVRAAGYSHACTTVPRRNRPDGDAWRIARFDVTPQRVCTESGEHDPDAFRAEVCALHATLL